MFFASLLPMKVLALFSLTLATLLAHPAALAGDIPVAPAPAKRPHDIVSPNGTRNDEYFWMRDDTRSAPELLAHLNSENAYTDAMLAPTRATQDRLFSEMVARIQQDDTSAPVLDKGWWYYTRDIAGRQYPVYARKRGTLDAPEQVMIDVNVLAEGHDYFQIRATEVSPDGRLLAYAVDTVGRLQHSIRFVDLLTRRAIPDQVENAEAAIAWANDNRTVYYVEKDPQTLLSTRVRRHVLGTNPKEDPLVYEEKDPSFYISVHRSRSERFLFIDLSSTLTSETLYADATLDKPDFKVLIPREKDHEYTAEDLGDRWIIRTNWKATNFRLVEAPGATVADRSTWTDVLPHRSEALVQEFACFQEHLAVSERSGGLSRIRIIDWKDRSQHLITPDEPAYVMSLDSNPDTHSGELRYTYTSPKTPHTVYSQDMATGKRTLVKRTPVLGGFDPDNYVCEYLEAPARDGKRIPVSVVYRKGLRRDGSAPMLVYAYGSYGNPSEPEFVAKALSLLDRGGVYATAHIRGGSELGRAWYEDGKLLHKINTFTDYIDATDFLVQQGYASPVRVAGRGGSAGGLLMGALANLAPEKYCALVANVPWVDVVSDMLDTSVPLTTNEFDEWGNPAEKVYYDYMLSYSPYDNVKPRAYPAMFITGALHDSQVQYYNPAKWTARLRDNQTGTNPILLRMNMHASHGGKSGRFDRYHAVAEEYAFLFWRWGLPLD